MKLIIIFLSYTLFFLVACEKDSSKEVDQKKLSAMYAELQQLSESVVCDSADEWRFTGIGSKACGGPTSFIAYSSKIDTAAFLAKAEKYTSAMAEFNKKWEIISDCALVQAPDDVTCENGKPKLLYKNRFN